MGVTPPKLKILLVLEATLGGTRKCVVDLLRGLDPERFELTFAYANLRGDDRFQADLQELKSEARIRLVEIPMIRAIRPFADLRAGFQLWRLVRDLQPDIVHCHSSKAGFLGRVATKFARPCTPTVYTPNSMAFNIHPLYKYLEKLAAPFTNLLIAAADSEKEEILQERILPKRKIHTIPLGVSLPLTLRSSKLREELKLTSETKIILSVGRCTYQKDPFTFLAAAEKLCSPNAGLHFVWIGNGDLEAEFHRQISERGLDAFATHLGNRLDVQELLSGADVFVLPSRYESFGYVTCEAMAWGLPVIATDVIGTRSIVVSGETGVLVPAENSTALATEIQRLVGDSELCARFGRAGCERVRQHFSVEKMCADTERLYLGLAATIRNHDYGYGNTCQPHNQPNGL